MKNRIKSIIFDLDGTLIDSLPSITNAVNYTLEIFECKRLSLQEVSRIINKGDKYLFANALNSDDDEKIKRVCDVFLEYYSNNCDDKPYNKVEEILKTINNKGIPISLLTNKPEKITKKILTNTGLMNYFQLILADNGKNKLKPNPDLIYQIIDETGVENECTIIVGDSEVDIQAGKNAGIITCAVSFGYGNNNTIIEHNPDFIINTIQHVLYLL